MWLVPGKIVPALAGKEEIMEDRLPINTLVKLTTLGWNAIGGEHKRADELGYIFVIDHYFTDAEQRWPYKVRSITSGAIEGPLTREELEEIIDAPKAGAVGTFNAHSIATGEVLPATFDTPEQWERFGWALEEVAEGKES